NDGPAIAASENAVAYDAPFHDAIPIPIPPINDHAVPMAPVHTDGDAIAAAADVNLFSQSRRADSSSNDSQHSKTDDHSAHLCLLLLRPCLWPNAQKRRSFHGPREPRGVQLV